MKNFYATIIILFAAIPAQPNRALTQIFDSFGDICCNDEKAHLDNFALALQTQPESQGYLVVYGGKHQNYPYCHSRPNLPRRGEALARVARLKDYLANSRMVDPKRIVIIDGGYRESWFAELWIVPKGAGPPTPRPTLQPKDIRFRRGRIKKHDYECEV